MNECHWIWDSFSFPSRRWNADFSFWNHICKNNLIFHFLSPRMLIQEKTWGGGGWINSHSYSLSFSTSQSHSLCLHYPNPLSLYQTRKRWFSSIWRFVNDDDWVLPIFLIYTLGLSLIPSYSFVHKNIVFNQISQTFNHLAPLTWLSRNPLVINLGFLETQE